MENNIKNILSELYEIDESLKNKEQEVIKIIKAMINLRPNIKIDDDFKSELRSQIGKKIRSEKLKNYGKSRKPNIWKILTYVLGTAGIAAFGFFILNENFLNILPKEFGETKTVNIFEEKSKMLTFENGIKEMSGGFGSLKNLGVDSSAKGGMGGGGDVNLTEKTYDTSVSSSDEMLDRNMIMPIDPEWTPEIYRYSFSGELNFDLLSKMPVYKKEKNSNLAKTFASNFTNFSFAGVNIGNFSDLGVSNITLNQDKNFGYSLNIDFEYLNLNIYKNWTKWPQYDYNPNEKQIFLSETETIKIAKDFLKEYNIDVSSYGEAKLDNNYISILEKYTSAKIMPEYVNNNASVIFPLIVDGNMVSEEYGQESGVRVEVDLKEKKVTGLFGLGVSNYLKSYYETETNLENILKVANVGGRYGFYDYGNENVKYIYKTLKNPRLNYINTYKYDNFGQEQFLIPAIIFDIEDTQENIFIQTIVVPLVKDFYKYDNSGNIVGNSQD